MSQADGILMASFNNHFDSYIHRVHKRWIFWRLLERVGLSIAGGCAVALILGLILMTRGESALPLVSICIAISVVLGAIVGWINRPGALDAATEVDRQFGLADLLATALAIRQSKTFIANSQDQSWTATVLAIADARCAQLAGQSLLLRRYGPRAWGGIGLATATVMTIGFLSSNPILTHAGNRSAETNNASFVATKQMQNETADPDHPAMISVDNQPESPNASRIDSGRESTEKNNPSDSAGDSEHNSNTSADRAGTGTAQTAETIHHQSLPTGQFAGDPSAQSGNVIASGGSPSVNSNENLHDANSSGVATDHSANHRAGDWPGDDATMSSQSSDQKTITHPIPDAYRDLVRDYFSRD